MIISEADVQTQDVSALPKNAHSAELIGNNLMIGSLSGGVWKSVISSRNHIPESAGLDTLQIWKVKAVEIQ